MMIMMIRLLENSDWVLSIRDKPNCIVLAFKPAPATSTPLRALTGARANMVVGEDAADADATAFSTCCCIYQKQTVSRQRQQCPLRELLLLLLLQLHAAHGCNNHRIKPELNNLSTKEKRFLLRKILLNRLYYLLSCKVEQISLFTSVTAFIETSSISSVGSLVVKC